MSQALLQQHPKPPPPPGPTPPAPYSLHASYVYTLSDYEFILLRSVRNKPLFYLKIKQKKLNIIFFFKNAQCILGQLNGFALWDLLSTFTLQ